MSFVGSLRATLARRGARAERVTVEGAVGVFAARVALPADGAEEEDGVPSRCAVVPVGAGTTAPDAAVATFEPASAVSTDDRDGDVFDAVADEAEAGESARVLEDDAEAGESDAGAFADDEEARTSDAGAFDDDAEAGESAGPLDGDAEARTFDAGVLDDDAEADRSGADVSEALVDEPSFAFDSAEAFVGVPVPLFTLTTRLSGAPSWPRST